MMCAGGAGWQDMEDFNGHFPDEPGLADTILILLELRMMEMVVTTGAIGRANLQSNRHHQQTNTQLYTGWMSLLSPNRVKVLKGNVLSSTLQ